MKKRSSGIAVIEQAPAVCRLRVEAITDYQSLLALEPAWNQLADQAGVDHPFQFDWVRTWWEHFGGGKKLLVLVVRDGDQPQAIAPLLLNRQRMYGLKLRQLEFFHNDTTPRLDFLVARPDPEIYAALWKYLVGLHEVWDAIKLCQVPGGSPTLEHWNSLARAEGFLAGVWRCSNSPYLLLNGNWDDHLAGLRSDYRCELRRQERHLEELGPLELELVCSPDEVAAAIEETALMPAAGWKAKECAGIGRRSDTRRFYARLAERFSARGWLHLHFLRLNKQRIAFGFGVNYRNRLFVLRSGCRPEFASYAPYSVLLSRVIRRSFECGLAAIDLPGVDAGTGLEWTREAQPHYWMFVFQHAVRNSLLHHAKFRLAAWLHGHHPGQEADRRLPAAAA